MSGEVKDNQVPLEQSLQELQGIAHALRLGPLQKAELERCASSMEQALAQLRARALPGTIDHPLPDLGSTQRHEQGLAKLEEITRSLLRRGEGALAAELGEVLEALNHPPKVLIAILRNADPQVMACDAPVHVVIDTYDLAEYAEHEDASLDPDGDVRVRIRDEVQRPDPRFPLELWLEEREVEDDNDDEGEDDEEE